MCIYIHVCVCVRGVYYNIHVYVYIYMWNYVANTSCDLFEKEMSISSQIFANDAVPGITGQQSQTPSRENMLGK